MRDYLRGFAKPPTWSVWHSGLGSGYYADRLVGGRRESHEISAHCLACAKVEILARYGGKVDLRGWHRAQDMCGFYLLAVQRGVEADESSPAGGR